MGKNFEETLSPSELKREISITEDKLGKLEYQLKQLKMRLADAQKEAEEGTEELFWAEIRKFLDDLRKRLSEDMTDAEEKSLVEELARKFGILYEEETPEDLAAKILRIRIKNGCQTDTERREWIENLSADERRSMVEELAKMFEILDEE